WSGDPTFRELLGLAREATVATYTRKEVPVWDVVERLGWGDFARRSPFCQYYLATHDDSNPLTAPAGSLEVRFEPVYLGRLFGDLGLFAYHNLAETRLALRLEYDIGLFDEPDVARLGESLDALLSRAAARPDARLSTLLSGLGWLA